MSSFKVTVFVFALYIAAGQTTRPSPDRVELYPYGPGTSDATLVNDGGPISTQNIPFNMKIYGTTFSEIKAYYTGYLRLTCTAVSCPGRAYGYIRPFMDFGGEGGALHYRTTNDRLILDRASSDVRREFSTTAASFAATNVFIATWHDIHQHGVEPSRDGSRPTNRFQIVLAADGQKTFALMLYSNIDWKTDLWGGTIGFSVISPGYQYSHPYSKQETSLDVDINTNTPSNTPGEWIYEISSTTPDHSTPSR